MESRQKRFSLLWLVRAICAKNFAIIYRYGVNGHIAYDKRDSRCPRAQQNPPGAAGI
jgi:hypothetical protein